MVFMFSPRAGRVLALAVVVPLTVGCGGQPTAPSTAARPQVHQGRQGSAGQPTGTSTAAPPQVDAQPQPGDLLNAKADVVLTAVALRDEFEKDPNGSLRKYQGKVLEVSGLVQDYGYDFGGEGFLLLKGPGIVKMVCEDPRPASKAMPGQTVVLRGHCKPSVGVARWVIVKATGDPPPTLTAEQWAKDFAADEEATTKKLKGKFVTVTGQITKVENDGALIYLTPAGQKPAVQCRFASASQAEKERNKTLRVGQKVKVLGQTARGDPQLFSCEIVTVSP